MKVTVETLEKLNACKSGVVLFKKRFDGEADKKDVLVAAVEAGKYVGWVIEKLYSDVPLDTKIRAAIRCALVVYQEPGFISWAGAWLDGSDRTYTAANARATDAADAADAAWAAAYAAASAAVWAAVWASGTAAARAWAAAYAVAACAAARAANTEQKATIARILIEELEGDKKDENND